MNFYRAKKVIEFEEIEVELYEINIKSLLKIANNEYKNNEEIIIDNSNLTKEDFENVSLKAFNLIEKEFLELNKEHFSGEGEDTDKKKS